MVSSVIAMVQRGFFFLSVAVVALGACTQHNKSSCDLKMPLAREDVLQYQRNGCLSSSPWPLRFDIDLNGDGVAEEFLGTLSYVRGMNYALFAEVNGTWTLISNQDDIPSGHLGIEVRPESKDGWHNFVALQPSGTGTINRTEFKWNGDHYIRVD
jgi:hypothetical protein